MKFDMEKAAKEACDKFDREHGSEGEQESNEESCDDPLCPGCNKHMTDDERKQSLLGEKMMVSIVPNPEDPDGVQVGTIVDLPSTKSVAEIMLITIVKTMALAANETPEEVVMRLAENLKGNLVQSPQTYAK